MRVELVSHGSKTSLSGIGRYKREIFSRLQNLVEIESVETVPFFGAKYLSSLQHFPTHLKPHTAGSIVHFTQIMGASVQLWHPYHPCISTVHDLGVLVCPEDQLLWNPIDRKIFDLQIAGIKRMDWLAVNSDHTRGQVIEKLGFAEERVQTILHGVDFNNFYPQSNTKDALQEKYGLTLPDDVPILVYVGNEQPRKNLRMLLEALAILKGRGRRFLLLKVGGAGGARWRDQTKADLARLKLEQEVVLVGSVPDNELPWFYSNANLYVCPTSLEGNFNMSCMEALACGLPVLATEAALAPEEVSEAVVVVSSRNLEAFTEALDELVQTPSRIKELAQAATRVIAPFTWERTAQQFLNFYTKINRWHVENN